MKEEPLHTFMHAVASDCTSFEFIAVKEEWTEDDVRENNCDETQVPECEAVKEGEVQLKTEPSEQDTTEEQRSADRTLDNSRFIPCYQERPMIETDSATSTRYDEAAGAQGSKHCFNRQNESLKNTSIKFSSNTTYTSVFSALPLEGTVPLVTQCIGTDKDNFPSGRASVYDPRNEYTCDICQDVFTEKNSIRAHVKWHMRQLLLSCDICQKSFPDDSDLAIHYRTHTRQHPSSCSICNKTFSRSTYLKQHSLHHTGERPYSCSICQKRFSLKSTLKNHFRRHTGERPYSCNVCNKTFPGSNNLKRHSRVHTGEQPYSCGLCHKMFTQSSHLKVHVRQHMGDRPYSCTVCHKTFAHSSSLNRHSLLHTMKTL